MGWLAVAAALLAFAVYEVVVHGLAPWWLLAVVVPELTHLGGRHPRDLVHRPIVPLGLVAVVLVTLILTRVFPDSDGIEATRTVALVGYVIGLAWLAHLAVDRALRSGQRSAGGR